MRVSLRVLAIVSTPVLLLLVVAGLIMVANSPGALSLTHAQPPTATPTPVEPATPTPFAPTATPASTPVPTVEVPAVPSPMPDDCS